MTRSVSVLLFVIGICGCGICGCVGTIEDRVCTGAQCDNPCAGVTCSEHGTCKTEQGNALYANVMRGIGPMVCVV